MSGSSIGTIAGAVVGGIIGSFFGPAGSYAGVYAGISLGAALGGAVGGILDPPKGPVNNGPRLNDLTVQTATYGAFLTRAYSTIAVWGNIFWLENGKLKEVSKKAKAAGGGKGGALGGGGKAGVNYTYFATFALGLVDCSGGDPIVGVRRIWVGPKLIYDAGSSDYQALIASNKASEFFTLYTGTDTQLPDPRMQATLGAANVPGYHGLAYIVFNDFALADHGNSLVAAQFKVEIVYSGVISFYFQQKSYVAAEQAVKMVIQDKYAYVVTDTSTDMGSGDLTRMLRIYDISNVGAIFEVGRILMAGGASEISIKGFFVFVGMGGNQYFYVFNVSAPGAPYLVAGPVFTNIWLDAMCIVDNRYLYITSLYDNGVQVIDILSPAVPVVGEYHNEYAVKAISLVAVNNYLYIPDRLGNQLAIYDIRTPMSPVPITTITINNFNYSIVHYNGYLFIAGNSNYILVASIANPISPVVISNISNNAGLLSISGHYLFATSGSRIDTYNIADPTNIVFIGSFIAPTSTLFRAIISADSNYLYTLSTYLSTTDTQLSALVFAEPTISSNTVPLGDIVQAEVLNSKLLTAADIDVTALTYPVRGYRIGGLGSIRGGIEPLQGAWPFDVIQHGYKIKFVPRGQSSVVTIPVELLDARAAGEKPGVQITNSREMDSILPQKVLLKYFDIEREYDTGEQPAERINTDSVNLLSIDMAIVFNATEAAGKAQVLLYLYWMERYDIAFSLPPEYNNLEPSDIITITSSEATYILRIIAINYTSDGRLECRAKFNAAALYIPTAIGESGQFTGVTLVLPGDTLYQLLDIPLIQDGYDTAGFPVAMAGYLSGWPGGMLYRTVDNGQNWDDVQGFEPPGSVIGYGVTALSVHGGTVLDKSSALTVRMRSGSLSSVTEAQMFAGSNWFAYGLDQRWEIIAVQNCVLQGDGTYILTDFLRGQFGTEWATGLHNFVDSFVHLSSSELAFTMMNLASIGVEAEYRGITSGALIDSDIDRAFTYRGVNLECLSPCHLTGNRHPTTNDWTVQWTRRTRFAGWRDYVDAALGEATEAYEVDIFTDNTYAVVKRTLTSVTPTATYTSSQQIADFGDIQTNVYVKIYQLSANVGRGYPLTGSTANAYNVVLLLHCNGSDGSTSFPDSSLNIKTVVATGATVSTTQSKFGGASGAIGAVGKYLTVTTAADFNFSTGDFTVEAQVYITSFDRLQSVLNIGSYSSGILFRLQSGKIEFWMLGTSFEFATTISTGVWHHYEISRSGTTLRAFLDGVQVGSNQTSTQSIPAADIIIGKSQHNDTEYLTGYLDEIRLMKGRANHTANFTPPSAEY